MSLSPASKSRRAKPRSLASRSTGDPPPRPPLGVNRASDQVSYPASAPSGSPLRTADHPATPWWSALLRGGEGAEAGSLRGMEVERWAGRGER